MKKILLSLCACLTIVAAHAQYTVSGKVTDKAAGTPIELATIQLLNKDSSYVNGISTSKNGIFSLSVKKAGEYLVKISFIGYNAEYRHATLSKKSTRGKARHSGFEHKRSDA